MNIIREYHKDTELTVEYWKDSKGSLIVIKYLDELDRLHRDNKPAFYYFYNDGMILQHRYFIHGKRTRKDGPASISYHPNGDVWKEEYWKDDILIDAKIY